MRRGQARARDARRGRPVRRQRLPRRDRAAQAAERHARADAARHRDQVHVRACRGDAAAARA
eukprot:2300115-Prymnesium_polylepis.2